MALNDADFWGEVPCRVFFAGKKRENLIEYGAYMATQLIYIYIYIHVIHIYIYVSISSLGDMSIVVR